MSHPLMDPLIPAMFFGVELQIRDGREGTELSTLLSSLPIASPINFGSTYAQVGQPNIGQI
ncbi:hypothetical protein U9M48_007670 [Paspalum notatum var. saurae]|uniref:Uncharacterized protein n=1 Tax=Paspalum notatum var. saurae TaxID=547442 RepID=A0AAQ3WC64_PASNO